MTKHTEELSEYDEGWSNAKMVVLSALAEELASSVHSGELTRDTAVRLYSKAGSVEEGPAGKMVDFMMRRHLKKLNN
ncbi:hypothetical protein AB0942_26965 [Streptomyces nodosus]|uniref:hypothetical protein n=1 Tax=Streptomyces nodosus TaxID=40318 RepID=UPI0034516C7B